MPTYALFFDFAVLLFGFDTAAECETIKKNMLAAQPNRGSYHYVDDKGRSSNASRLYCIELPAGVIPVSR